MVMVHGQPPSQFVLVLLTDGAAALLSFVKLLVLLGGYAVGPAEMALSGLFWITLRQPEVPWLQP